MPTKIKWIAYMAMAAAGPLAFAGCGPSEAKSVPFIGTWNITNENGISGTKDTQTVTVTADKDKFKTVATDPMGETTIVYDGDVLNQKFTASSTPADPAAGAPMPIPMPMPSAASVQSRQMSKMETMPMRFWAHMYMGKAGPGGQVAGQETVLYQARENRPDGEITAQAWVDAKTGIVLKSIETIYSKQVDSMVSKVTRECQEIKYAPVDASAFAKP